MAVKKKYYAVKVGLVPGVYTTWAECAQVVNGFSGAIYKAFSTEKEAYEFIGINCQDKVDSIVVEDNTYIVASSVSNQESHKAIVYVDGSYMSSVSSTKVGSGVVVLYKDSILKWNKCFDDAELAQMHQVGGEINAAIMGVEKAISLGATSVLVRYDYLGVELWATGKWKRNKVKTQEYYQKMQKLMTLIKVEFEHVKAHTGEEYNELADRLAKEAII